MKNNILLFVVVCASLACSANLMAKERRGAEVVITKTDGQKIKGELIVVKANSLLLLESGTGVDMSIDIKDVKTIKVVYKSKTLQGAVIGFLAGVACFGIFGEKATESGEGINNLYFAAGFGALGAIPGALIGTLLGTDITIELEGKRPSEIEPMLKQLSSKARIKNYQ